MHTLRFQRRSLLAFGVVACLVLVSGGPPVGPGDLRALPPGADGATSHCSSKVCLEAMHALAREDYRAAAEKLEPYLKNKRLAELSPTAYGDLLALTAHALERSGRPKSAAHHWLRAGALSDSLNRYFKFRALRSLLTLDQPPKQWLKDLVADGAAEENFPGAAVTRMRAEAATAEGLPGEEVVRAALESKRRERACRWLTQRLQNQSPTDSDADAKRLNALRNLAWGGCPDVEGASFEAPDGFEPTARAHFRRSEHLFFAVEYEDALRSIRGADIDAIDDATLQCRARFRLARTLYRLDRFDAAEKEYRRIVEDCDAVETNDPRIRSLYAIGRRNYFRGRLDASQKAYRQILEDYPQRSHADDALMFLARIARKRGDRDRARRLLERALSEYPDGDMVHEMAWEYLEPAFKAGNYQAFERQLSELKLPERDDQYFSQGRLGYFRGLARTRSGDAAGAVETWQDTWSQYPFSFYGYLAHVALREAGHAPDALVEAGSPAPADWFFDPEWPGTGVRRLLELDLPTMAVDVEAGRVRQIDDPKPRDWWRLAALYAEAGDFHESHMIARRRIGAAPWMAPKPGRVDRWTVAFPDAFGSQIASAIRAEQRQVGSEGVPGRLIQALMREESGFRAEVVSWAGAVGLMQLMPATARHHDEDLERPATVERLKSPAVNIRVGVDHLFFLAERLDSHPVAMVAAYNAGIGAVGSWLDGDTDEIAIWVEDIPYRQTRHYAKHVVGSWAAYQWLDGRRRLDPGVAADLPTD